MPSPATDVKSTVQADSPPVTPYEMLGGADVVDAIVRHFYELMDGEPAYSDLRAIHAEDLGPVREGLTQFLNAWLGGPRDWFGRGKCVMSLHRDFPISSAIAEQWAEAMSRAITAQAGIDPGLAQAMAERLGQMAHAMVNQADRASAA